MTIDRESLIEYYEMHLCDIIPYSHPNYAEELRKSAEAMADDYINYMTKPQAYFGNVIEDELDRL